MCCVTGVLRLVLRWCVLGVVLSVRGHVGLLDVVLSPSTLACPCVATLDSPRIATLGSPWERAACNFLIIFSHCFFSLAAAGISFLIFSNNSVAASTVLSSSVVVGMR